MKPDGNFTCIWLPDREFGRKLNKNKANKTIANNKVKLENKTKKEINKLRIQ